MILSNAFRRLGLPATATPRETRRALEELGVRASLGQTDSPSLESLSELRQALDDPVERLREELSWIHSPPDLVDPRIDMSSDVQVSHAVTRLQAAAGRGATREQAIALHDLAVVTYGHDIEEGLRGDESEALGHWATVFTGDEFWRYLEERAAAARDPRLTDAFVAGLRSDLPSRLLTGVAERAAAFIDGNEFEHAGATIRALRRSGFPEEDVGAATRQAASPLRAKAEAGITELDRCRRTLKASEGASPENRAGFERAQAVLITRVMAQVERLRRVDPLGEPAIGDRAAEGARALSVDAYNVLNDWDASYLLARMALKIARTQGVLSDLARDQAVVAKTYHQEHAHEDTAARRVAQAAAHFELAADFAEDEADRQELLNVARGAQIQGRLTESDVAAAKRSISEELEEQTSQMTGWIEAAAVRSDDENEAALAQAVSPPPRVQERSKARPASRRPWVVAALALAALGGGFGLWYALGNASSSPSPDARATPISTSKPSSSRSDITQPRPPKPACSDLGALDASLSSLDLQVKSKQEEITQLDNRSAGVVGKLNDFLAAHPEQSLAAADYAAYVRLRRDVRTYDRERKPLVRSANSSIASYNATLRRYNELTKEC